MRPNTDEKRQRLSFEGSENEATISRKKSDAKPRRRLSYHRIAAIEEIPPRGDGEDEPFVVRYINLIAYWPALVTLYVLSISFGVWKYFQHFSLDTFSLFGVEDYIQLAGVSLVTLLDYALLSTIIFVPLAVIIFLLYVIWMVSINIFANIVNIFKRIRGRHRYNLLRNMKFIGAVKVSAIISGILSSLVFFLASLGASDTSEQLDRIGEQVNKMNTFRQFGSQYEVAGMVLVLAVVAILSTYPKWTGRIFTVLTCIAGLVLPAFASFAYLDADRNLTRVDELTIGVERMEACPTLDEVNARKTGKSFNFDIRRQYVLWASSKATIIQCNYEAYVPDPQGMWTIDKDGKLEQVTDSEGKADRLSEKDYTEIHTVYGNDNVIASQS